MKGPLINLFDYLDYRQYLRDFYNHSKKTHASFSFRDFSKKAGFKSPNFLKLVMEGDRNLTEDSLPPFMTGLGLNKQEQEFFRNLVFFNQAKSHERKDFYYQRLLQSRKFVELKPIHKDQYEYCSEWYHSVVRELVASSNFDGTPEWVSSQIHPVVTPGQVQKSLSMLERLKFLERDSEGRLRQVSSLVSTGAEVTSVDLVNYHVGMLDLTKEVFNSVLPHHRDVSALTLGIKKNLLPDLKEKIKNFRKEILELVSTDPDPQIVIQLNMQMFPLTKIEGDL